MQVLHEDLDDAAAGLVERVAELPAGQVDVPGLHADDGWVGLVGEDVLVGQARRAAGDVHPRAHADAAEVGDGQHDVELLVERLAAAVARQPEPGQEPLLVGQCELVVHGGRDLREDLRRRVRPLVDRPDALAVEVRAWQVVGIAQPARADADVPVVERQDAEFLALLQPTEVPLRHALEPRVDPFGPIEHVRERVLQPPPRDELIHDAEPVAGHPVLDHRQDAVVQLAQTLVVPLRLVPIDGHLGHGDPGRVVVAVQDGVETGRPELVIGPGRVHLDAPARILHGDRAVDHRLVDAVVSHVIPVIERRAEVPFLVAGELVFGLELDLVARLVPRAVLEQDHRPDALEPIEPPPQLGLLLLHRQRSDLRPLLREIPQDGALFGRDTHISPPLERCPSEPRPLGSGTAAGRVLWTRPIAPLRSRL